MALNIRLVFYAIVPLLKLAELVIVSIMERNKGSQTEDDWDSFDVYVESRQTKVDKYRQTNLELAKKLTEMENLCRALKAELCHLQRENFKLNLRWKCSNASSLFDEGEWELWIECEIGFSLVLQISAFLCVCFADWWTSPR